MRKGIVKTTATASKGWVMREAIIQFGGDVTNRDNYSRIVHLAQQIGESKGYTPDEITMKDFHNVQQSTIRKYGSFTVENVRKWHTTTDPISGKNRLNGEPATPQPSSVHPGKRRSRTFLVREAFLQQDDPATCDINRVLTVARAKYQQEGGDPRKIKYQFVTDLKHRFKGTYHMPFTKANLQTVVNETEDRFQWENPAYMQSRKKKKIVHRVPVARPEPKVYGVIDQLKAAKQLVAVCGGDYDTAKKSLTILEVITE